MTFTAYRRAGSRLPKNEAGFFLQSGQVFVLMGLYYTINCMLVTP